MFYDYNFCIKYLGIFIIFCETKDFIQRNAGIARKRALSLLGITIIQAL